MKGRRVDEVIVLFSFEHVKERISFCEPVALLVSCWCPLFVYLFFPMVEEHCMVLTLDFQFVNTYLAMFLMWFINEKFVLVGDYGLSLV